MGVPATFRTHRYRWLAGLMVLVVTLSVLPAVESPRRAEAPGTPDAVAGPGPVERDLPAGARSNSAPAKRTPVVPPGIRAAEAPRQLSAEQWARTRKPAPLGPSGPAAQNEGPNNAQSNTQNNAQDEAQDVVFEDLELRPGYVLGDTSLVAYFNLHNDDRSFASWTVRVFDAAAGTEQASSTLAPADLDPPCDTIRKYCKSFGAAQGWVLDPAKDYFITITAVFADGREVVSAPSGTSKPRATIVPPSISAGQAAGCGCGNALGLTEGGQAVRGIGVNTATGAYSRLERDLSMASFGVPFASIRTYSSALVNPGPFGPGWAWSYGMRVSVVEEGAVVRAEDGAEAFYRLADDGSFVRPAGVRSNLRRVGTGFELVTREQMVYGFDADGRLTAVLSPRRIGVRLAYTDTGVTLTDASGRVATATLAGGLISKVELPDGRNVRYGYENGRLSSVKDARGNTWRYTYSATGLLTQVISPIRVGSPARNVVDVRNEYDANGRVVQQFDALNNLTKFVWNAGAQEATTTDPDGVVTFDGYHDNVLIYTQRGGRDAVNHRYDGALNRNLVVNGKQNQHESAFDGNGNVVEQRAPLPFAFNEITKYDARNNPIEHTDARGNVWKNTFNAFNELVESTDAEGNKIRLEYDARGLLTLQTDQRGKVTRFEYLPVGDRNSGLLKALISPEARRTESTYDTTGRKIATTDPRGTVPGADRNAFTMRIEYNEADQVTAVWEPGKEHPTRTEYDAAGRITARITPTGVTTKQTYFDNGLLRTISDPRRDTSFTYTAAGRRLSERANLDPDPDIVTTYGYNAKGLLDRVTSPRGNVPGANPAEFTTTYFYDGNDNLVRMRRPYPGAPGFVDKDFKVDALDRTTSTVDEQNGTTAFERDNAGNVTAATDTLGRTTRMGYDKNGNQTSSTNNAGQTTGFQYDAAGNKIRQTMPEGGVTTWEYDGDGMLVASTEPRGNAPGAVKDRFTTRYRYDRAGNPSETIDPLGHSTIYNYDANNRLAFATDAKGRTTHYAYDDDNRPRLVHLADAPYNPGRPEDNATVYAYHADGLLKSVRDPNGHTNSFDYDEAGRLTSQVDPLGRRTEMTYDAESNPITKLTFAAGERLDATARAKRTIVDTYDIVGRPVKRQLGSTGPVYTFGYDAKDRTTFYGDPAGKREVTYDGEDQVTSVTRTENGGPVETFGYSYDERGNITRRTYPDGTRLDSTYDRDSRLTSLTTSGGATGAAPAVWRFDYDVAGRRTGTTLPAATGLVETRAYDDAGRLTNVATTRPGTARAKAPTGPGSASTPDTSESDGAAATTDRPGAPTAVVAQAGAGQAALTWKPPSDTGDAALTGYVITATPGGQTVEAAPGATAAVVNGLEPGTAYTFTVTASNKFGAGPASKASTPVTPVALPQNPVSAFQLDLDELGNPTRVVTTRGGVSESVAYTYDKVDRVTSACYGATTCSGASAGRIDYRYDLVGNRTSQTMSGSAGSGIVRYQYDDADQLTRQSTSGATSAVVDYSYDVDGNQTKAGGDTFEYHLDHSLAKATVSGRTTTFGYDAAGLRLTATTGTGDQATTQRWSWDTNGSLPQIVQDTVTNPAGTVLDKRDFVYGPDDEPLGLVDPGSGVHSYTHDWLGGVADLVSPAGTPEEGYDYDPFGNPRMGETLKQGGSAGIAAGGQSTLTGGTGPTNPLQYAGAYQDSTTGNGNYYLRARNYNPGSGRFTATDPMPRGGAATSSYAYADNNPLALTDPTGAMPIADGGGGGQTAPPDTGDQPVGGPSPEEVARAQQLQNKSLLDVVLEAGGQILMEILGINDIINCLKGDIGACVMTVVGALPWGKIFKAKKIAEALWRAGKAIFKFFEEIKWARAILRGAQEAAAAAKAAAARAAKAAADKAAAIKAAAERAAKKAADDAAARAKALAAKAKAATKKGSGKSDDAVDDIGRTCPSGPHSFVAGTPVRLADGTDKAIDEVEAGDTVLATDPITGETEARQVTRTIRTDDDKDFVDLTLAGGQKLTTTEHHPFWSVTQDRWVDAGQLRVGELLRTSAGTYVQLAAISTYQSQRITYDLTVDQTHTYYVAAGEQTVLVHNCTGNLQSGNSAAAAQGRDVHNGTEWGEHLDSLGYQRGGPLPNGDIPDGFTDAGFPVELKPDTRSGIRAGTRQLRRYMREMGVDYGELWVWKMDAAGDVTFRLAAVPKSPFRWLRW